MSEQRLLSSLLCFCLLGLGSPAQGGEGATNRLPARLDEALDLALRNRTEVSIASRQSAGAAHRVSVAKGSFLPQLSFSGTSRYLRALDKFSGIEADARLGEQTFHVRVEKEVPSFEMSAGLDLTWNLYSGGQDKASLEAVLAERNALRQEESATRQKVSQEVMTAYWKLRKSQIQTRVAERAYLYATKQYLIAQTKRGAGLISEIEVENEALALQENVLAVADSRRELSRCLAGYRESLGLAVADPQQAGERVELLDDPDSVADGEMLPAAERPQTRKLMAESIAAEARVRGAEAVYRPRIDFFTSYKMIGRNDDYFKSTQVRPDYYVVGATLTVPLFDGFRERIELARSEEELARLRVAQNIRQLEAEDVRMNSDREKSHQEVQMAELRMKLFDMKKRLAREMYRNGKIPEIELMEAEKNYDDHADKLLLAKIDGAVARQAIALGNRSN